MSDPLAPFASVRPLGELAPDITRQGTIEWSAPGGAWALYVTPLATATQVSVATDEGYEYALPDLHVSIGTPPMFYRAAVALVLARRWSVDGGEALSIGELLAAGLDHEALRAAFDLDPGEHAGRFTVTEDESHFARLVRS